MGKTKLFLGFLMGFLIVMGTSLADAVTTIMPLGDSITQGVGSTDEVAVPRDCNFGYRLPLYNKLINEGNDVVFVGNQIQPVNSCTSYGIQINWNRSHEGHPGWRADQIRDEVIGFLQANPADIVLLHIGTNDLNSGQTPSDIVTEVRQILDRIDQYESANSREVKVIIARIINRVPLSSTYSQYNTELAAMAQTRIANGDKITIVDMENGAGIDYGVEMNDAYHPDENGYAKMADVWYNAIVQMLPPSPPRNLNIGTTQGNNTFFTMDHSDTILTSPEVANWAQRTWKRIY
jgi:lysophospholipase L1-like esterase